MAVIGDIFDYHNWWGVIASRGKGQKFYRTPTMHRAEHTTKNDLVYNVIRL